MKIKKIRIQNFKVFQDAIIDFEGSDLIVFDGPNGFGKTSIYDSIELLFTGKIRRFDDLKDKVVDGRENFSEHPFLCDYSNGDICLTLEFSKGDSLYIFERLAKREELTNSIDFSLYNLYRKNDFNSEERNLIENEDEYLSQILGQNYKQNFQFLNYIEQEDSLFLLKSHDKNRKQHISHLFNVSEFENRKNKIDKLKNKINESCSSEKQNEINDLKESIREIEEFLAGEFKDVQYLKLFTDKEFSWDSEVFNYQSYSYENLFNLEGIIPKLKQLVGNKELLKKYVKNQTIDRLINNRERVQDFLLYFNFFSERESLRKQKNQIENINKTINQLTDLSIDNIKSEYFKINLIDFDFINEHNVSDFDERYSFLRKNLEELNDLENIFSKIEETRSELIYQIKCRKEEEEIELNGNCYLCGYDWGSFELLLNNIEMQSSDLEKITSSKSKIFNEELINFKDEIITPLILLFRQEFDNINIDLNFVNKFLLTDELYFASIKKDFEIVNFNYTEYLNEILDSSIIIEIDNVIVPKLESLKFEIEVGEVKSYFTELFEQYFENKFEFLDLVGQEDIIQKENYLKFKYSLLQNERLDRNKQELINKENKFTNAKQLETNLKNLNSIYKNSLKQYQRKVIEDIEIIFHIYSGRIMQDFQGGLGLFIYSDSSGIRFQTNPSKTFDAVFSMSSGQLATLIISFTLALHKKYSQNKIILIDDPVQTMDEINIVGFIELLRNEFNTHQLVISTHEDMASAFMRYKFKNYGLSQKRINLKAHQN